MSGREYFGVPSTPKNELFIRIQKILRCVWDSLKQLVLRDYPVAAGLALGCIPLSYFSGASCLIFPFFLFSASVFKGVRQFQQDEAKAKSEVTLEVLQKVKLHFCRSNFVQSITAQNTVEGLQDTLSYVLTQLTWYNDALSYSRQYPITNVFNDISKIYEYEFLGKVLNLLKESKNVNISLWVSEINKCISKIQDQISESEDQLLRMVYPTV